VLVVVADGRREFAVAQELHHTERHRLPMGRLRTTAVVVDPVLGGRIRFTDLQCVK
jgi:hypothetical protein